MDICLYLDLEVWPYINSWERVQKKNEQSTCFDKLLDSKTVGLREN